MVWIKIERLPEEQDSKTNILYLPRDRFGELNLDNNEEITLEFGQKKAKTRVSWIEKKEKIYCSSGLLKNTLLKPTQIYQFKIKSNTLQLGPVIGLLLGEQQYYYHHSFMQEYTDAMARAKEIGGLVVAFKLCSIDWESQSVYGLYYNMAKKRWKYGICPIPTVIYRRAFNNEGRDIQRLKNIVGRKFFFNEKKLDKLEIYNRLKDCPSFKQYLPETALLTIKAFKRMLADHSKIILKPASLSRGRGICIIHKMDSILTVFDSLESDAPVKFNADEEETIKYISKKGFLQKKYLIQPYLSLSKINHSPWDIRIVMQKNEKLKWQCNGIECRLAGDYSYLTNISRGGRALTINHAIRLSQGPQANAAEIKENLIRVAMEFCKIMDEQPECFAEFGMDFALDENQRYWFIEANVRATFNGFKKLDYNNYYHICSAPFLYAASLSGFRRIKNYE